LNLDSSILPNNFLLKNGFLIKVTQAYPFLQHNPRFLFFGLLKSLPILATVSSRHYFARIFFLCEKNYTKKINKYKKKTKIKISRRQKEGKERQFVKE
jgi:hypothetical protein